MGKQVLGLVLLLLVLFSAPALATHIQYFSYADVTSASFSPVNNNIWSNTFKLTEDSMELWDIDSATQLADGSYAPAADLHYVTLRIDPNNYTENPTSNYLGLKVNGIGIADWSNPISLYSWGVPGGPVTDEYGIPALDFKVFIELYALPSLASLADNKLPLTVTNVNLEGCFDSATTNTTTVVPEPSTLLLLGVGLIGLAGWRRRNSL